MDPSLGNLMTNLRRQMANKKITSFEAVRKENSVMSIDMVPLQAIAPHVAKKRGRPAKTARLNVEAGPSARRPSMLSPLLEVVSGVQIDMTPKDESILAVVPTTTWSQSGWSYRVGR